MVIEEHGNEVAMASSLNPTGKSFFVREYQAPKNVSVPTLNTLQPPAAWYGGYLLR